MSQPDNTLLEAANTVDDWGDFSAVISQLEQQEQTESEAVNLTESNQTVTEDKTEAVAGLLEVAFTLTEQATALISGVEFEFDAKGKQAVIDAAVPVFDKHGSALMGVFGDYIEEATLALAVLGLAYASRKQLAVLKREQMEAAHGEKAETVSTA